MFWILGSTITYAVSPVGFCAKRKKEPSRWWRSFRDDAPEYDGKVYIPCDEHLIGPRRIGIRYMEEAHN